MSAVSSEGAGEATRPAIALRAPDGLEAWTLSLGGDEFAVFAWPDLPEARSAGA